MPVGAWPRSLRAGDRLRLGRVRGGTRAYLAIDGGFVEPPAAIGSRKLRRGDLLGRARSAPGRGRIPPPTAGRVLDPTVVRAIPGPHLGWFSAEGLDLKGIAPLLLDFPAELDGDTVLLCWLEGERELRWYHKPEHGFAGRRPIPDTAG